MQPMWMQKVKQVVAPTYSFTFTTNACFIVRNTNTP
uniref:Uncharacterized protein n=1 Tax=Ciona intestinalis TaxID=7719 RepID=F7BLZ6_CIOIN